MSGPIHPPKKQPLLWASVYELVTLFDTEAERLVNLIFPIASGQYVQVPSDVIAECQKLLFAINGARSQFNEYVRVPLSQHQPTEVITEHTHTKALELSIIGRQITENLSTVGLLYQEHMNKVINEETPNV